MKTRFFLLPIALISTAAVASPADDLTRVEVTGQKSAIERYDVRQACHSIDTALSNRLSGTWFKEQPVGEMTVRFQLDGSEVSEVKTQGFSVMYRQTRNAMRNAVMNLDCKADAAGQQNYAFKIVFKEPTDGEDGERFAISEIRVASRGE